MDEPETAIFLRALRGVYQDFRVDAPIKPGQQSPTVTMWHRLLADVSLPDAVDALTAWAADNERPPTPAAIRERDPNKWRRDYANNRHLEPAARLMSGSSDRESSSRPALAD